MERSDSIGNFQIAFNDRVELTDIEVEAVHDEGALLRILMSAGDAAFEVHFSKWLFFSSRDETAAQRFLSQPPFRPRRTWLYFANDSALLRFIRYEGWGMYDDLDARHYVIVTNNDVIDVITDGPPVVRSVPS